MKYYLPILLSMFCLIHVSMFGDVIIVDPDGSADFTTIQAAINDSGTVAGDVVIVRPGTYLENINLQGKAITLRSTDPTDPAVVTSTIIDGEGAGSVITCNSGEDPNTVISGFIIINGSGTFEGAPDCSGGGMYNYASSPTVTNCTFSGNIARYGSGMYNYRSSPTVTHCSFIGNTADRGGGMLNHHSSPTVTHCTFSGNNLGFSFDGPFYGGGMCNYSSSVTVTHCTFSGNTAPACSSSGFNYDSGGGIYNSASSVTVTYCTFSGNSADDFGGGICNRSDSNVTVSDCTFSGNTADLGGGMMNWGIMDLDAYVAISNCTFSGNTATDGGGIYNIESYSVMVSDCAFSGNTAADFGGGMCNHSFAPKIMNCTFSDNNATDGGGMHNYDSSSMVTNCIFSSNTATNFGGGMCNYDDSSPTVTDSYFCLNTPEAIEGSYTDAGGNNLQFCPPPKPIEPPLFGDSDGDGDVDMIDLAAFAANWLAGVNNQSFGN